MNMHAKAFAAGYNKGPLKRKWIHIIVLFPWGGWRFARCLLIVVQHSTAQLESDFNKSKHIYWDKDGDSAAMANRDELIKSMRITHTTYNEARGPEWSQPRPSPRTPSTPQSAGQKVRGYFSRRLSGSQEKEKERPVTKWPDVPGAAAQVPKSPRSPRLLEKRTKGRREEYVKRPRGADHINTHTGGGLYRAVTNLEGEKKEKSKPKLKRNATLPSPRKTTPNLRRSVSEAKPKSPGTLRSSEVITTLDANPSAYESPKSPERRRSFTPISGFASTFRERFKSRAGEEVIGPEEARRRIERAEVEMEKARRAREKIQSGLMEVSIRPPKESAYWARSQGSAPLHAPPRPGGVAVVRVEGEEERRRSGGSWARATEAQLRGVRTDGGSERSSSHSGKLASKAVESERGTGSGNTTSKRSSKPGSRTSHIELGSRGSRASKRSSGRLGDFIDSSADMLDEAVAKLSQKMRPGFEHLGQSNLSLTLSSKKSKSRKGSADSDASFYCGGQEGEVNFVNVKIPEKREGRLGREECRLCRRQGVASSRGLCGECEGEFARPVTMVGGRREGSDRSGSGSWTSRYSYISGIEEEEEERVHPTLPLNIRKSSVSHPVKEQVEQYVPARAEWGTTRRPNADAKSNRPLKLTEGFQGSGKAVEEDGPPSPRPKVTDLETKMKNRRMTFGGQKEFRDTRYYDFYDDILEEGSGGMI